MSSEEEPALPGPARGSSPHLLVPASVGSGYTSAQTAGLNATASAPGGIADSARAGRALSHGRGRGEDPTSSSRPPPTSPQKIQSARQAPLAPASGRPKLPGSPEGPVPSPPNRHGPGAQKLRSTRPLGERMASPGGGGENLPAGKKSDYMLSRGGAFSLPPGQQATDAPCSSVSGRCVPIRGRLARNVWNAGDPAAPAKGWMGGAGWRYLAPARIRHGSVGGAIAPGRAIPGR